MRMDMFLIIVGMALVTYLTRTAGLLLNRFGSGFSSLEKWLRPIPTAMLTALILPSLLLPGGTLHVGADNPYLLAGIVSLLIATKTGSIFITVGVGMALMLALRCAGL